MKITIKRIGVFFFLTLSFFYVSGQTDNYYYYKGEKIYLEPDYSTISISIEGENAIEEFNLTLRDNEKVEKTTENYYRNILTGMDHNAEETYRNKRFFYTEINYERSIDVHQHRRRLEEIKKSPNVLMATSGFLINGKKIGLSNNFYVELQNESDIDKLYELAGRYDIEVLGYNKLMPRWFTLSCNKKSKLNSLEAANVFYESSYFNNAEPAFMVQLELNYTTPNDPLYNNQWYLKNVGQNGGVSGIDIKAESAWNITKGDGINVAVIDDGFQMNHPDLQANTVGNGFDAHTGTSPSILRGNHGTACTGIIGAAQNNSIGISGVSPESGLISVSSELTTSAQKVAYGMSWAVNNGASVLSNSWTWVQSSYIDVAISNAFIYGRGGLGTVVVFASGNNNSSTSNYPGNSQPLILNVGAIDRCGIRSGWTGIITEATPCNPWTGNSPGSSYGTTLDVVAGGSRISTTDRTGNAGYVTGDYYYFSGTSASCPMVAGIAALVLSVNPDLTVIEVNNIIEQTAQKIRPDIYTYTTTPGRPNGPWNNKVGYGLVNAYEAVKLALSLYCPEDLTIDFDVPSNETYLLSAQNTITASNTIEANATAEYDAGDSVTLTTGFHAKQNSDFRAYLEGCTPSGTKSSPYTEETITYHTLALPNRETKTHKDGGELLIYPNPTTDQVFLQASQPAIEEVSLSDIRGVEVLREKSGTARAVLDVSHLPAGVYFMNVSSSGKTQTYKLIKK